MKHLALAAIAVLLALVCIFCAVFSICMIASPDDTDDTDTDADANTDTDKGDGDGTTDGDTNAGTDTGTDTGTGDDTENGDDDDDTPKKKVAITLDDGPYSGYQKKFIDEMSKYGGAATFFIVGNRVDWHESTGPGLAYAVENGWEIGIHGWSHTKFFNKCTDAEYKSEIDNTVNIIHKYLPNYDIKLLRPPGGAGQISAARIAASPYAVIHWDVDSLDYNYQGTSAGVKEQNVQAIVNNVMAQVRDGSIILMHELYENSFDAYCRILKTLDEQGYEFVTVSELLGDKYQAGKVFNHGR